MNTPPVQTEFQKLVAIDSRLSELEALLRTLLKERQHERDPIPPFK